MYEAIEHWKQYKLKQEKLKLKKEFDKWLSELIIKNGTTDYSSWQKPRVNQI